MNLKAHDELKFIESMEKMVCEKLNISFCRCVLRVHKKFQVTAVRGELGRAPLSIDIAANVLKNKEYLESKKENGLLQKALSVCKMMPPSTT